MALLAFALPVFAACGVGRDPVTSVESESNTVEPSGGSVGSPARARQLVGEPTGEYPPGTSVELPSDVVPPRKLIGTNEPRGVWFLTSSADVTTVHFASEGLTDIETWELPVGGALPLGLEYGFDVAPSGQVLIGHAEQLLVFDTVSETLDVNHLPELEAQPLAQPWLPEDARDEQSIRAVSYDPDTGIAWIAVGNARVLVAFDVSDSSFSTVDLPDIGDANDVAALADGSVLVGMRNYESGRPDTVVRIGDAGGPQNLDVESWFVGRAGSKAVVGLTSVSVIEGRQVETFVDPTEAVVRADVEPVLLDDGRIVAATETGFVVIDTHLGSRTPLDFPTYACSPEGMPSIPFSLDSESAPPEGAGEGCSSWPIALAASGTELYYAVATSPVTLRVADTGSL